MAGSHSTVVTAPPGRGARVKPCPMQSPTSQRLLAQLRFPCGDVPEPGIIKNVAPGIYWLRMPLPFQLNHINLWLIEENDGWTIVDTGINTDATRELWEKIFAEQLRRQAGDRASSPRTSIPTMSASPAGCASAGTRRSA